MSEIIPFDNAEEAYKFLKDRLVKKGYKLNNISKIDYGIQFFVFLNKKPYLVLNLFVLFSYFEPFF